VTVTTLVLLHSVTVVVPDGKLTVVVMVRVIVSAEPAWVEPRGVVVPTVMVVALGPEDVVSVPTRTEVNVDVELVTL
jgi:hypothetical protein